MTRFFTKEQMAMLGTDRDIVIAKRLGVARSTVAILRQALGIQHYRWPKKVGGRRYIVLPKEIIQQLGTAPDHVLAKLAGVSMTKICRERIDREIPAYKRWAR